MATRKIFNAVYFLAAVSVFSWLLRDHPHLRIVPFICMTLCGFYGLLAAVAVLKPNGFAVGSEVFSAKKQRCLRRWALLAPIPALLYFSLYSSCVYHAGEWRCLNKYFGPIAKFERAAFCRNRMAHFVLATHGRIQASAESFEMQKDWQSARSYYKALTALENALYERRLPTSYAIMACLYERMGETDRAERMYRKAERAANKMHDKETGRSWTNVVSLPHAFKELSDVKTGRIGRDYPKLSQYYALSDAPSSILGRHFIELNLSCDKHKDRDDCCKLSTMQSSANCDKHKDGDDCCKLAALHANVNCDKHKDRDDCCKLAEVAKVMKVDE